MPRRKQKPYVPDMVRVIRTTRDSSRDYWIPREDAQKFYDSGRFSLVNVYGGRFDYYDEEAKECR